MCGIVGTNIRKNGFKMYEQNLSRGFYSSSVVAIYSNEIRVIKKLGALAFAEIPCNAQYYLFHSRGPTVETGKFNWDDNHPFIYGNFAVSHNGIIENSDSLYDGNIGVDSRVIPYLIDKMYRECDDIYESIRQVLNQLQGTFSLSILDLSNKKIYIVRHDTTLFDNGIEFSSSNPGDFKSVTQNTIFSIDFINQKKMELGQIISTRKPKYFIPS